MLIISPQMLILESENTPKMANLTLLGIDKSPDFSDTYI
ncbi:hypothetical protein SPLC1_S100440 [Arthrospira platensis C1]|nr:hypothetical protein SPLC1_S100440 [Arthrospira platensis C1]